MREIHFFETYTEIGVCEIHLFEIYTIVEVTFVLEILGMSQILTNLNIIKLDTVD